MKKLLIAFLIMSGLTIQAQETQNIEVGTIVTIEKPSTSDFNYVHFPRKNFIIKKGGVVNYQRELGEKVEIVALETKNDGTRQARIQRTDGKKFFQSYASLLVDIDKAIEAGEITI